MATYLIHRLLSGTLVLLGVTLVIFVLFLLINVDPAKMTLGQRADIASVEAVQQRLGLDKPWYSRMARYLNEISPIGWHGNTPADREELGGLALITANQHVLLLKWPYLGRSFQSDRRVGQLLTQALRNTLILALAALIIALIIGLSLGMLAALRAGSWLDRLLVSIAAVGVSIPSYFSAIVLSFLLGYVYQAYTGLPMIGSLYALDGSIMWRNLVLPAIALGIRPVAVITQLTRSTLLDVLEQDYMRTAKAKGLSPWVVVLRHGLRNAINPVITAVSGWLASLLAGAYFVEVIFNFKGLGYTTIKAIETYDFPVIMGAVLLGASIFVVINVVVDILYAVFDPKIKMSK